jgi:hypothetical protein
MPNKTADEAHLQAMPSADRAPCPTELGASERPVDSQAAQACVASRKHARTTQAMKGIADIAAPPHDKQPLVRCCRVTAVSRYRSRAFGLPAILIVVVVVVVGASAAAAVVVVVAANDVPIAAVAPVVFFDLLASFVSDRNSAQRKQFSSALLRTQPVTLHNGPQCTAYALPLQQGCTVVQIFAEIYVADLCRSLGQG